MQKFETIVKQHRKDVETVWNELLKRKEKLEQELQGINRQMLLSQGAYLTLGKVLEDFKKESNTKPKEK